MNKEEKRKYHELLNANLRAYDDVPSIDVKDFFLVRGEIRTPIISPESKKRFQEYLDLSYSNKGGGEDEY